MAPQYLSTWDEPGFREASNHPQFAKAIGVSTSSEKSSRSMRVDLHGTTFRTGLQLVYDCRVRCDNRKSCPRPVVSFMSMRQKSSPTGLCI